MTVGLRAVTMAVRFISTRVLARDRPNTLANNRNHNLKVLTMF